MLRDRAEICRYYIFVVHYASVSNPLQTHVLQHARLPCPSPSPGACSNSCPLSVMPSNDLVFCHPIPFSSCLLSFPALRSIPMSQLWPKYWSFSISLSNEYSGLFPLGLTGLISLLSKGLSKVFSSTTVRKHQFFGAQPSLWSNSHIHT